MECLFLRSNGDKEFLHLSSNVFEEKYNEALLHQLITCYLSNSHKRIKKQKSRSEVSGGGRKPWKQKGGGKARAGSIRSPLWRGGGKTFAANGCPVLKKKINKKMYNLGMRIILSNLVYKKRITIIDSIKLSEIKTKFFLQKIGYLNLIKFSLLVVDNFDFNIKLSSKNLDNVFVTCYKYLNPVMLLKFKFIFITKIAIRYIEERFNECK